jgi:cytosine/adenosine deaminase-related metal-dependent hydrolase
MVEPGTWIENGEVEISRGRITAVGQSGSGSGKLDHGSGVIMPALINAHAHLSLSNLACRLLPGLLFLEWVKELIRERDHSSADEISTAAMDAALRAKQSGTGFIAEVGPLEPGLSALERARLHGMVFVEVLGNLLMAFPLPQSSDSVVFSYAGHALHTTSPDVLQLLKGLTVRLNQPFSIHLAESEAETVFLAGARGEWADLLGSRGVDFRCWDIRNERPIARAERFGLLSPGTLVVHALQVNREEISALAQCGVSLCVCPRSNLALHGRLPDIDAFLSAGLRPALGTDSLASTASLNMFDEMAFVADHYRGLAPDTILAMATTFGATALGRPELGSVKPGRAARLIYVDMTADSAYSAASKLVTGDFKEVRWL